MFDKLEFDTISEGKSIDPGDEARLMNEALADFIAGQVVSGANYWRPTSSDPVVPNDTTMHFCDDRGICLDANDSISGSIDGTPAHDHMKKIATILQDAFDGHIKGSLDPTNGDAWTATTHADGSAGLEFTPDPYGDSNDEVVKLGGPKLVSHAITSWRTAWVATELHHSSWACAGHSRRE